MRKKRKAKSPNQNFKLSVKERIMNRTFNRNKSRNHIKIDPQNHIPADAIFQIAQALMEPKVELIGTVLLNWLIQIINGDNR